MMTFLFWFSLLMIAYAYFGYPLALFFISIFKKNKSRDYEEKTDQDYQPFVSFIITAYNEENRIGEKIATTLLLEYPKEKLEIIVASDCSNDKTDEIVRSYEKQGVSLIRAAERRGKEHAQKLAVSASKGEIIIFSDVATHIQPDGISQIVKNFSDPLIGCVSSEDRFLDPEGKISGEGVYVKYEMFLRKLESKVNTVVGLSGSFFAARREVCEDWKEDLQSDFNTLLNSIRLGLRGISDPQSLGYYKNITDEKKEFDRKVRTVLRGISVLRRNLSLLNPARYGMFSWQLFSHKLCRWLVPFFIVLVFLSNTLIITDQDGKSEWIYWGSLLFQIGLYLMALMYYKKFSGNGANGSSILPNQLLSLYVSMSKICYFFVLVNVSILVAWGEFITGERAVSWEPSKR